MKNVSGPVPGPGQTLAPLDPSCEGHFTSSSRSETLLSFLRLNVIPSTLLNLDLLSATQYSPEQKIKHMYQHIRTESKKNTSDNTKLEKHKGALGEGSARHRTELKLVEQTNRTDSTSQENNNRGRNKGRQNTTADEFHLRHFSFSPRRHQSSVAIQTRPSRPLEPKISTIVFLVHCRSCA